jgi:hypothetical protein
MYLCETFSNEKMKISLRDINFLLRQVHSDSGLRYGISNPSFCTPNNTTMQKLTEVEDCAVVHELDLGAKIRRADH